MCCIFKYIVAIFFILFLFSSCNKKQIPGSISKPGWTLVWQDEFNYTGLPDAKNWGYEVGHIRNNEQQYYTNARKENVWVENGVLTITGRKETFPNEFYKAASADWRYKNQTAQYTAASINTLGKAGWQYGRIEIKAKLPQGGGIWPALWMMGANRPQVGWPASGEIDIMEFIGAKDPNTIYGTIHYKNDAKGHLSSGGKTTSGKLLKDFHIYAIEWDSTKIDLYFDDLKFHSFLINTAGNYQETFRKPFYLLINMAMGGNWPGPVNDAILPQQYLVDYVRVYRKK